MVDRTLILRKLSELEQYLVQISEFSNITAGGYLNDWKIQRIIERTLQIKKWEVKDMTTIQKAPAEKIVEKIPIDEIREALINEYRRRLIRYKMIDEAMRKKYGMSFSDFESANMVRERKFSWDVESDSMEWEHALEGIRYVEKKLKYIEEL